MEDFYISAIRMNSTGKHIEWVKVHKKTSETSLDTNGSTSSRKFVGELISTGKVEFKTVTWNSESRKWTIGAKVEVMSDGYITTDRNKTMRDNLGNLPTF